MALHHPGETLTLADCGDVYPALVGQGLDGQFLADLIAVHLVEAEFHELQARFYAGSSKVPGLRPV